MSPAAIVLFTTTMLIALWAMIRVRRVYAKWSKVPSSAGVCGAEAAAAILDKAGIHDVEIVEHNELLGDHYDPAHKRLVLSSQNYHSTSVAALGVAAHECGHAIQHQLGYAPLQWRMAAIGATQFASQIVLWLPLFGLLAGALNGPAVARVLALSWGAIMMFNLITLPVEFDASRRAKRILADMGCVCSDCEKAGVCRTLDAASWTYVAAFITSFGYFVWHSLLVIAGRRV